MSSVLAVDPWADRTQRFEALPTEVMLRPRPTRTVPPNLWRVECAIHAVGRFGSGPVPAVVLGFVLAVAGSLHIR